MVRNRYGIYFKLISLAIKGWGLQSPFIVNFFNVTMNLSNLSKLSKKDLEELELYFIKAIYTTMRNWPKVAIKDRGKALNELRRNFSTLNKIREARKAKPVFLKDFKIGDDPITFKFI